MAPKFLQPRFYPGTFVRAVLLVTITCLLVTGASQAASPPDFKLKDIEGNWFTLGEHLGKEVVYVSFWATWNARMWIK